MRNLPVILLHVFLLCSSILCAQNQTWNMVEEGFLNPIGEDYNDIWGFEKGGSDYAVIGSVSTIFVVDVTDCSNPEEVASFQPTGSNNIWRDFKTANNRIYAVCDNCGEGLVILDYSGLPGGSVTEAYSDTEFFTRAHNIYIDGDYLYAVGTDVEPEGIVILDISDPDDPVLEVSVNLDIQRHGAATSTNYYIHDINVSNDIAYACHGNWQEFAAWDVSDLSDIKFITSYETGEYTHSSWNTDGEDYAYVCEEVPIGMPVQILSLSDIGGNNPEIQFEGDFKDPIEAPNDTDSRPHNPFVKDDTLFISYYHDGIHLYDVSDPDDPEHIAYYDTYTPNDGNGYSGFNGAWGVYPYLSSGCILVSDIESGLRILRYSVAVPVTWSNIGATLTREEDGKINWTTASEINNDYFEILKSTTGNTYEVIGEVKGSGNSSVDNHYEFIDDNVHSGVTYYKIRQVDYDGNSSYSPIRTIRLQSNEQAFTINPNPSSADEIKVTTNNINAEIDFYLYDASGKKIDHLSKVVKNQEHLVLRPSINLSSGQYYLRMYDGYNLLDTKRITIVK